MRSSGYTFTSALLFAMVAVGHAEAEPSTSNDNKRADRAYINSINAKNDGKYAESFRALIEAAELGSSSASSEVAQIFLSGEMFNVADRFSTTKKVPLWKIPVDKVKAEYWLRRAVENAQDSQIEQPFHSFVLACFLYKNESGTNKNEAFTWMKKAADGNDLQAKLYVSAYLRLGVGIAANEDEANHILTETLAIIYRKQPNPAAEVMGGYADLVPSLLRKDASQMLVEGQCAPVDVRGSYIAEVAATAK